MNVTEPDVHVSGTSAWISYINKGSVGDASSTTNQPWLESAFLLCQIAYSSHQATRLMQE